MTKSIEIWDKRLEILDQEVGSKYMISDSDLHLFIHADKLKLGQPGYPNGWLLMYNNNDVYIGSIWIKTDTDMKKIQKFLEETK